MKILVSGATGFIGQHLIARLASQHTIQAIIRPSTDISFLNQHHIRTYTFDGQIDGLITHLQVEKFDGVIHLASLFLAQHTPADTRSLVESNVLFSTMLLEAAVQSKIPWLINTGTFWQHYNNSDYSPVNLYAATKQAFQDIAQYYIETGVINFVTLQLSDTFGPGDTRKKIFNLWGKIANSRELLEMSPGEQMFDISYIDNVVDAYSRLVTLMSKDTSGALSGQVFAVSSGQVTTLKKLAKLFEKVLRTTIPIVWGAKPYRPREVMKPWNKGRPVPGWKPKVSLEDGIRKTFHGQP